MPIRPEERARYPDNWPEISRDSRSRAGNWCEHCGVKNHELGGHDTEGRWWRALPFGTDGLQTVWPREGELARCMRNGHTIILRIVRIVLTVAHMDHRPENCAPENLKALCQRCHNLYDAPMRRAGVVARWRAKLGMDDLFGEPACG